MDIQSRAAAGSTQGNEHADLEVSTRRHAFDDRVQAGRELAAAVKRLGLVSPVVLALPRGGVPVAREVAATLSAPLGLLLVRKIGVPGQPELAVAAVAESLRPGGSTHLAVDQRILAMTHTPEAHVQRERVAQELELQRRRQVYLPARERPAVAGAEIVLVDDGIATGTTVRAALMALRDAAVARITLAVPVAPPQALRELRSLVDQVVCLWQPEPFHAVGMHYADFRQVSDDEVKRLMACHDTPSLPRAV